MAFRFPPPPPPPPKATSSEQRYASQRGGHARGGGDRARGMSGNHNRGGGSSNSGGNARGGHGQNRGRGDARGRGGQRGGYQNNRVGANHRGGSNTSSGQNQLNAPSNTASAIDYNRLSQGAAQQQYDPNALAQVMSYMSTPAGVQSMAAYASHMTSTGNTSFPQSPLSHQSQSSPRCSPQQHAGQKRKLNDRNNNAPKSSSKPPRAKAAVPPQIPSFGFSLPPPLAVRPDDKKRKVNLGLSHQPVPDESGDEEDIDEEAVYTEKLKGGGFAFEHNGETISIQTGAEVAAWIKDRRSNFPTEKRAMEKAEEAARKRAAELDFLRRVSGKPPRDYNTDTLNAQTKPREKRQDDRMNRVDRAKQDAENRRQEELATLRKKLHESMVKKQSAPSMVDLGLGYESDTESEAESSVLSESSVVSSSEEDESESESDDSDDAPEPTSSKLAPPPIRVPPAPAPKKAETKSKSICTNWKRNGKCPYLSKCKYQHPPKEDEKLPGLYERMVEQELVKADQLALAAIKYLGQNGFLG